MSSFASGDTLLNVDRPDLGVPAHLWIIVSNPQADPTQVLLVNLSTYDMTNDLCEDTCILNTGDHPFVRHPSYIVYGRARTSTIEQLQAGINSEVLRFHQPLTTDVLDRVRAGALTSPNLEPRFKALLRDQGFG